MKTVAVETYTCRLYIAGSIETAKAILREECWHRGLCITIEPTTFIYTGGEEAGYVVGLVNYPRFPTMPEALLALADELLAILVCRTHQTSGLLVASDVTRWFTRRDEVAR